MKKVFFITTAHLSEGLWFRDDEDFKVGMNFVAIQAWRSGVVILAFVLMSNHLHFVLIGTEESVSDFICGLKGRYSLFLRKKYGYKEFLRRNDVDIREIDFEDEALEKIAALHAFVNGEEEGGVLSADDWSRIKDEVGYEAENIPMDLLSSMMQTVVEKGGMN